MNKTFAFITILILALVTPASAFFFFGYDQPTFEGGEDTETIVDGDGSETPIDGDGSETLLSSGPIIPDFWSYPDFFDTSPDIDDTPPSFIPDDFPAVWNSLSNVQIPRATQTGTIIYEDITTECRDPDDDNLVFKVESDSEYFDLSFVGTDLAIYYLNENFVGTETVRVSCNAISTTFKLAVFDDTGSSNGGDNEDVSVHIGSIRIPNQYDSLAGDLVPVIVSVRNNGDKRLEDLTLNVAIQELGIRSARVGPFDLTVGKRMTKLLYIQLPENVKPCTYYARITMDSSNGLSRTIHRDIEVIN